MSHELLKLIDNLKLRYPEEALKTLNKATGLTWASMPVSLVNQTRKNSTVAERKH
ncbi:MAG: hypothetical protein H7A01_14330 [Hahellaceae bacterium]|nr:hypothetical protein [Hahellaceae bacterium]MCP5210234.1 hypothetical protein [Hahellaceae bacterium]